MHEKPEPVVAVLVPAAGHGTRLGGIRKQCRMLGGEPLLVSSLRSFEVHPRVAYVLVAVPEGDVMALASRLRDRGLRKVCAVVAGGDSRQASVGAALAAVPGDTDVVLVHDAARPFVPPGGLDAVIDAVLRDGAAALAVPVADTLRRASGACFGATVDRNGLFRMQTPQAFRRAWLEEAHRAAHEEGYEGSDDVALVQRLGRSVVPVPGSALNLKITTPDDWDLAQRIRASWGSSPEPDQPPGGVDQSSGDPSRSSDA